MPAADMPLAADAQIVVQPSTEQQQGVEVHQQWQSQSAAVAIVQGSNRLDDLLSWGPSNLLQVFQAATQHNERAQHLVSEDNLKISSSDASGRVDRDALTLDEAAAGRAQQVFTVQPVCCQILPGQQQRFTVKLRSGVLGLHHAVLLGKQRIMSVGAMVSDDGDSNNAQPKQAGSELSLNLWPAPRAAVSAASARCLEVEISGVTLNAT
jgi:hypothetical protein